MFLFSCQIYIYLCMYVCMHVCTKSFLKTTTNSLCVCAHLVNKADSDSDMLLCMWPCWGVCVHACVCVCVCARVCVWSALCSTSVSFPQGSPVTHSTAVITLLAACCLLSKLDFKIVCVCVFVFPGLMSADWWSLFGFNYTVGDWLCLCTSLKQKTQLG